MKEEKENLLDKRGGRTNTVQGPMESPLFFESPAGTHIDHACAEATALAINSGKEVHFQFNDVDLIAFPERSAKQLSADYHEICRIRAEKYRNSPEGIAAAEHRRSEILCKQQKVDALIKYLPKALEQGLDEAVQWIKDFTDPADDIAVKFDKAALISTFHAYGYETNENVGEPTGWFNTRERIGRYLIGQVMNCLANGMPPHPRVLSFCDTYFKTRKTRKARSVGRENEEQPVTPGSPESSSSVGGKE